MQEEFKKHPTKEWEVSLIKLKDGMFKVTRRMHSLSVSETKVFASKQEAKRQFDEWLL